MLEWKEIKGYDYGVHYNWQEGVELPELGEEVLIQRPGASPFVGYFEETGFGIWICISANGGMDFGRLRDGIRWARFNRPSE